MFDRSLVGASLPCRATATLGAAVVAATFIQSASASVTLSNWSGGSFGNAITGGTAFVNKVAVKFTTGNGSNWELTSIRARCDGSGMTMGVQIWTDGASGLDPTGAGATLVPGSSVNVPYNWSNPTPTFTFGSGAVQLVGGQSYWAVFTTFPGGGTSNRSNWWGSVTTPTTNGSGWTLGASRGFVGGGGAGDTWAGLMGIGFGGDWATSRPMTAEIEFSANGIVPAPGALALLGLAGLARRRRRQR